VHSSHKTGKYCDDSPSDEDSRNPDTRSDPVQQKIAGDLKYEITEKEDSGDESVLLAGNRQILVHCQRSKSYVVSVEHGNNEQYENKRDDPSADLAVYRVLNQAWSNDRTSHFCPPKLLNPPTQSIAIIDSGQSCYCRKATTKTQINGILIMVRRK
jgi:hypothetical protein